MGVGSSAALADPVALTRIVARNIGVTPAQLSAGLLNAGAADFDDVLAFRRQHLHASSRWDDAAYLRWRYRFGNAAAGFGDLWVLRRDGATLGILGLENLRCTVGGGDPLDGVRGMDLLVRRDLVDTGLGGWLNQCMLESFPFALAMGANANSMGIVRRMFRPLPARRTFTHPIDARPFAARRWPRLRTAITAAAPVANGALALRGAWHMRGALAGLHVEPVPRFTEAMLPAPVVDDPARVHVVRPAAHLNRRLLDNPRRACQVRVAQRGPSPVGYVAWAFGADVEGNTEMHIVDWQCEAPPLLRSLLRVAVGEAFAQACSCVRVVLQDTEEQSIAEAAGFVSARDDDGRITGVQAKDSALARRLVQARWALTDVTDDADV